MNNTVYIFNDISLSVSSPIEEAYGIVSGRLHRAHISLRDVTFSVYRKSVDARKKNDVRLVYSIAAYGIRENIPEKTCKDLHIARLSDSTLSFSIGTKPLSNAPVILGAGP